MATVAMRFRFPDDDNWHQGYVMLRDDYREQKYQLLQLKEGEWPKSNAMGMEFMQADYYHVNLGDRLIFEIDKKERSYAIGSKIRHPFTPPPSLGYDLTFFFTDAEGMERFGLAQGQFTSVMVRVTPYSLAHAKEVASDIKDRLGQQDIGVNATEYQDPDKHWGRTFMDSFVLVLQVMAVVSLLLSTVLVLNTFMALITQQTNQIGMLKAVGGTSGTILQVYLAGVVVYGLLALCVSFPLGAFAAYKGAYFFLALFNIPHETFLVSEQAVVLQLVAAIIVPVVAALWPIFNGARISVRQAMASYGLGGDFGSGRFDRAVERVGARLFPSHYAAALANTFRRKGRLILTEIVLIVAGAMFLMLMSLNASITTTMDAEFARRHYDLTVTFEKPQRIDRAVPLASEMPEVKRAEMFFSHSVSVLYQGQRTREAGIASQLIGVIVQDAMYVPMITDGRWLVPGDERAIVMNREVANDNHLKVGDTVTLDLADLGKSDWQIVGLHKALATGDFSVNTIYAPIESVLSATNRIGRGRGDQRAHGQARCGERSDGCRPASGDLRPKEHEGHGNHHRAGGSDADRHAVCDDRIHALGDGLFGGAGRRHRADGGTLHRSHRTNQRDRYPAGGRGAVRHHHADVHDGRGAPGCVELAVRDSDRADRGAGLCRDIGPRDVRHESRVSVRLPSGGRMVSGGGHHRSGCLDRAGAQCDQHQCAAEPGIRVNARVKGAVNWVTRMGLVSWGEAGPLTFSVAISGASAPVPLAFLAANPVGAAPTPRSGGRQIASARSDCRRGMVMRGVGARTVEHGRSGTHAAVRWEANRMREIGLLSWHGMRAWEPALLNMVGAAPTPRATLAHHS